MLGFPIHYSSGLRLLGFQLFGFHCRGLHVGNPSPYEGRESLIRDLHFRSLLRGVAQFLIQERSLRATVSLAVEIRGESLPSGVVQFVTW